MDERHHHENDPHGTFASARAARDKLAQFDEHAEQQKVLPDLNVRRDAIVAEKQQVADRIHDIDVWGQRHGGAELLGEPIPPAEGERESFVARLADLNLQLDQVNREIADLGQVMADHDRRAHVDDLQRRVATGR